LLSSLYSEYPHYAFGGRIRTQINALQKTRHGSVGKLVMVTRQSLLERFQLLNDDELLVQFHSGELTDLAKSVAGEELLQRGIDISEPFVPIARYFTVAEVDMLKSRLEAEGVPAIKAVPPIAIAVSGVRVLVPESYVDRAREIVRGVERGDYVLRNDSDAAHVSRNRKSPSFSRSQGERIWEGICVFVAVGFGSALVILIAGYQFLLFAMSNNVCSENGYCGELVALLALSSFFLLGSYVAIRVATAEDAKTAGDGGPGST